MSKLILLRHGQSLWNLENRFTGEVDVDLSDQGLAEARSAGTLLRDANINVAFTSKLKRAIHTLDIVLHEVGIIIPIFQSDALNERSYGKLQGLNKAEVRKEFGSKKVLLWRRSFRSRPPGGESLKDTFERVVPYYQNAILPLLKLDKTILVVAHGNSLRALTMYLEHLTENEVALLDIPTGVPRSYNYSALSDEAIKQQYTYENLVGTH